MSITNIQILEGSIVENEIHMTITELCHATNAAEEHVIAWVYEGILNPTGHSPDDWRFSGDSLQRALQALRLSRDLEINTPGVAMVLELLDEIARLQK
ncbi:MAG: chaperone modulator CbpM [Methylotenera sp.]|jgi:chaperone modulatory protein CbpM|nr:chaperone modulator CbpM [Methylotenera sp.]PKO53538.1 MAG: MerR family transcriptional regulator [Betaproteobacteria bacterium HGW-Betaproteobacteria-20]